MNVTERAKQWLSATTTEAILFSDSDPACHQQVVNSLAQAKDLIKQLVAALEQKNAR